MSKSEIDRVSEFLRSHACSDQQPDDEIRAALEKGVSVRVRVKNGSRSFQVLFGVMPMAWEMALSIGFFGVLLVTGVVVEDARYPYLPFLVIVIFIGNLLFELSRYRIARKFIDDVQRAV
jgi:hypothetical protein